MFVLYLFKYLWFVYAKIIVMVFYLYLEISHQGGYNFSRPVVWNGKIIQSYWASSKICSKIPRKSTIQTGSWVGELGLIWDNSIIMSNNNIIYLAAWLMKVNVARNVINIYFFSRSPKSQNKMWSKIKIIFKYHAPFQLKSN